MFQQLVPLLRQRSVLLTVTSLEEDHQIRVNVLPKKLADGENAALTTPMSFTGTAAEPRRPTARCNCQLCRQSSGIEEHARPRQRGDGCGGKGSPGRSAKQVEDGQEGCPGRRTCKERGAENGRAANGAWTFRYSRSCRRKAHSSGPFGRRSRDSCGNQTG